MFVLKIYNNAWLVTHLLESNSISIPDKVAIVQRNTEYTYSFLNNEANKISRWLIHSGIKPGDRVILYGVNSERLITGLFGILKAGAVFVPVHPTSSYITLEFILRDCSPSAIILDDDLFINNDLFARYFFKSILLTSDIYSGNKTDKTTTWRTLQTYSGCSSSVSRISNDDLAAIIYTSGSTKYPRGVMELHKQILFATSSINTVIENKEDERILCGLPFSFDYGLYQIFLTFQVGATVIIEKDFSNPLAIPRILKINNITGFPGVPSLFAMLLRSKLLERIELPNLRYITSTGDVFPVAHIQRLKEIYPHINIFPMYGLTECKRVCIMPKGELETHESSVGKPLPGTHVFVADEAGKEISGVCVGELVIKGPHVMAGYWNNPEETKRRFRKDDSTGEVNLYSGDFFKIDLDGFLYFIGRDETFIKSRGQKISPAEIESYLCSLYGISESAVVGVPDSVLGEFVCAFVSVNKNNINLEDIFEHSKNTLSPAKYPKQIIMSESPLPKTQHGKIDRKKLREIAIKEFSGNRKL